MTDSNNSTDLIDAITDATVGVAAGAVGLAEDVFDGATDIIEAAISPRRTSGSRRLAALVALILLGAGIAAWLKKQSEDKADRPAESKTT